MILYAELDAWLARQKQIIRQTVLLPSHFFEELYRDIAFGLPAGDFKLIVDAVPRGSPEVVRDAYARVAPLAGEALKAFIDAYFDFTDVRIDTIAPPVGMTMDEHIEWLWPHLTKGAAQVSSGSTLLPLPHPYVVPGGRFQELYYWDSYFTMLGFGDAQKDLRDGMIANFAHMLRTYGHIPNANRSYYLSRSQPPFFFKMVALTSPDDEAAAFAEFLPELKTEYTHWMRGGPERYGAVMPDGSQLNHYWDADDGPRDESFPYDLRLAQDQRGKCRDIRAGAESGWDYSSRWFADGASMATIETTSIIPVCLNSLLYGLELSISAGCVRVGDVNDAAMFDALAKQRRTAMNAYLWNDERGVYLDYQLREGQQKGGTTAATLYPLFVGLADMNQAKRVARTAERELLKAGGLVTTTKVTGEQWDAPNGWAPLQWVAVDGLHRYGEDALAAEIAQRWLATVGQFYEVNGRLLEKYDFVNAGCEGGGGEYQLQDGFGWTNGVTKKLGDLYPSFTFRFSGSGGR